MSGGVGVGNDDDEVKKERRGKEELAPTVSCICPAMWNARANKARDTGCKERPRIGFWLAHDQPGKCVTSLMTYGRHKSTHWISQCRYFVASAPRAAPRSVTSPRPSPAIVFWNSRTRRKRATREFSRISSRTIPTVRNCDKDRYLIFNCVICTLEIILHEN